MSVAPAGLNAWQGAAAWLRGQSGWRAMVIALCLGAASALAFAPYGFIPLLLIGYAGLLVQIDAASAGERPVAGAFAVGWAFGFGQFLAGLYWIAYPFLVDPIAHAWQIPFALTLLPAGLALFPGAAAAACARFWRADGTRLFVFAVALSLAEYARGHVLTGFPWNLTGYGWGASLAVLQSASVFGVYGLSLLTICFAGALALAGDARPKAWVAAAVMTALFAALWGLGLLRLASLPMVPVPGAHLRIVQPNVPEAEKYVRDYQLRNWQRLTDLSAAPAAQAPNILIWPEAAPPFLLSRARFARADIMRLTQGGAVLVTGVVRANLDAEDRPVFHNSVDIFAKSALVAVYDKFHLVPFGEYLPLAGLLGRLGIDKLVQMPGGFAAGGGPRTIALPGLPSVGPLICYEIIFPGAVTSAKRPGWIANVTDDSWFGPAASSGPYQHLLSARVRAIEEGLPVARSANTGISALIDPEGRILGHLGSGKIGVVDGPLPRANPSPVYAQYGDGLYFFLLFVCTLIAYIDIDTIRRMIAKSPFPVR